MNKLLLLICIFHSLTYFSQAKKIKIKTEKEKAEKEKTTPPFHHGTIDLYYGNKGL
jgi:hypothetical protein